MKQTGNYNLNKPELTDPADITVISEDMETIDGVLKSHANILTNLSDAGSETNGIYTVGGVAKATQPMVLQSQGAAYKGKVMTVDSNGLVVPMNPTGGIEIGMYGFFAGNGTIPTGYLLCDGSAVSRTTYSKLFAVIGTTYGIGDNKTTFNLPDAKGRFFMADTVAGNYKAPGLPDIKGGFGVGCSSVQDGAFYATNDLGEHVKGGDSSSDGVRFAASRYNSIYGASDTVQPPALTVRVCIKATDAAGDSSGSGGTSNIIVSQTDIIAGQTPLQTGVEYLVYE